MTSSKNLCKWPACFCVFTYRAKKAAELEKRFSGLHLEPEQVVLSEQEVRQKEQRRAEEELKVLPVSSLLLNTWFGSVLTWRLVLCQKLELEERRKAEEELRRLEQERKQQIYISLKEVQGSKHTREEEEDKEWQNTRKENCTHTVYTFHQLLTRT